MASTVSVIIATYNRATLLDECLRHVAAQPFGPRDEVIVVDNGSTDHTAATLAAHAASFPVPLRRLEEPRAGKSHALARALGVATGDLLVFTDDDVNVAGDWLASLQRAMAADDIALAGGAVAPRWERRPPRWLGLKGTAYNRLAAPIALLNYGPTPIDLGPRTVLGANLAVRRTVLRQVGGFATHLGKLRGTLLSGEDHDLCRRVQAAGFRAVYAPAMRVEHWVPSDRLQVSYFVKWFFWSGITNAALDETGGRDLPSTPGLVRHMLRRACIGIAGGVIAAAHGDLTTAMNRLMEVPFAIGYIARSLGMVGMAASSPQPAGEIA